MKGKILLVTGVAIGYVLGAKAGRQRYEDIKATASKLWGDPRVQKQVHDAGDFVKDKAPDVAGAVADGAKKVASQVSGKKPATRSTRKPASSK